MVPKTLNITIPMEMKQPVVLLDFLSDELNSHLLCLLLKWFRQDCCFVLLSPVPPSVIPHTADSRHAPVPFGCRLVGKPMRYPPIASPQPPYSKTPLPFGYRQFGLSHSLVLMLGTMSHLPSHQSLVAMLKAPTPLRLPRHVG